MHGLILTAIQSFFTSTYGWARWKTVMSRLGTGTSGFEAMLPYPPDLFEALLATVGDELGRARAGLLEDVGTYLVSHPETEALRRLLRFGGESYVDFLHSLDELPGRARLAVDDLDLPPLELREEAGNRFTLLCGEGLPGFPDVLAGVVRAMADDYGALVLLERREATARGGGLIIITLVEPSFSRGREFRLGAAGP